MKNAVSKMLIAGMLMLVASLAQAECKDCGTFDFNKKFQTHLLAPMLSMTLEEKTNYMKSFGVELYRIADPLKKPVTLGFLPEIPPGKFSKKYTDEFSSAGFLGLYLTPTNFAYNVTTPTILFLESTDDWTLVHEFSHYLFDRARLLEDPTRESTLMNRSADAREDFFNARDKYRNFDMYVDDAHKKQTIDSFVVYANTELAFVRSTPFEETTIEKMIRSFYKTQKPHGFKAKQFERSTRYIKETSGKGLETLGNLLRHCEELGKTLKPQDTELIMALVKTCGEAASLRDEDLKLLHDLKIKLDTPQN